MPHHAFTAADDKYIKENAGVKTWKEIGRHLKVDSEQARKRLYNISRKQKRLNSSDQGIPEEEKEQLVRENTNGQETISSRSTGIRTVQDLIRHCKIDLTLVRLLRSKVTAYQSFFRNKQDPTTKRGGGKGWIRTAEKVQMYSVQATFERIIDAAENNILRDQLLHDMKKYSPRFVPFIKHTKSSPGDRNMLAIAIPDQHWNKLSWAPETGETYDLGEASHRFINAITDFISRSSHQKIDKILLVVGNDALNVDSSANETTAGTPQDCSSKWQAAFLEAKRCYVRAIEMARKVAPVDVRVCAGNHDYHSAFFLGDTLEAWFRNYRDVKVDNSPAPRKYVEYGANLIGLAHGDTPKNSRLALLMPVEAPMAWSRTKCREWLVGHLHKKAEDRYMGTDTEVAVVVRTVSSLSAGDAWHVRSGYKGPRASEAFTYNFERGYQSHLSHNVWDATLAA